MTRQESPLLPQKTNPAQHIKLLVSDMDGTLLTPEKQVTHRTLTAIAALKQAGVPVCLVSSRPASGIEMYLEALKLDTPYGALNGGCIFNPDHSVRSQISLPKDAVQDVLEMLDVHGIEAWLFRGRDWLITHETGAYVEAEKRAIRQSPKVVASFAHVLDGVDKITASTTDYEALTRQEMEIGALLQGRASVARSMPFYLDITAQDANKGYALRQLADFYGIAPHEVACIGDMNNDLPMFAEAGVAIAMGQAEEAVKQQAHYCAPPNTQEGWASAVTEFILPRAVRAD